MATTNHMTVTKETTLGDIEQNDRDNYKETVEKNHRIYRFLSVSSAQKFMGQAVDKILKRCGVTVQPGTRGKIIEHRMKKNGVEVEHRKYDEDEELYRSGLFIYKHGELVGYASSPFVSCPEQKFLTPMSIYIQTTETDM